ISVYVICILALSISYVINLSGGATSAWGQAHGLGYSENFLILILYTALIPLALLSVRIRSVEELRFVILVWITGSLYGAAFVVAYCNGWISHYDRYWHYSGRAAGFALQPNAQGIYTAMAVPGLLLFWSKLRHWLPRLSI